MLKTLTAVAAWVNENLMGCGYSAVTLDNGLRLVVTRNGNIVLSHQSDQPDHGITAVEYWLERQLLSQGRAQ